MHAMLVAGWRQGDVAGANVWLGKISGSPLAGRDDRIFAAWFELVEGKADRNTLARFKKAQLYGDSDEQYGLTLAFIETKLGLSDDAQPDFARAVSGEDLETMPAAAWAVHGAICAQYRIQRVRRFGVG